MTLKGILYHANVELHDQCLLEIDIIILYVLRGVNEESKDAD